MHWNNPDGVDASGIQSVYAALAADDRRNDLICTDRLKALEEGRTPLLLTERTAQLDELAQLDTLLLALPVSWRGTVQQYAGRLNRLHPDKRDVRIYDYLDADFPVLARMYGRRLKGHRALGYMIQSTDDYRPRSDVSPAQLNGMRQLEVEWERQ